MFEKETQIISDCRRWGQPENDRRAVRVKLNKASVRYETGDPDWRPPLEAWENYSFSRRYSKSRWTYIWVVWGRRPRSAEKRRRGPQKPTEPLARVMRATPEHVFDIDQVARALTGALKGTNIANPSEIEG